MKWHFVHKQNCLKLGRQIWQLDSNCFGVRVQFMTSFPGPFVFLHNSTAYIFLSSIYIFVIYISHMHIYFSYIFLSYISGLINFPSSRYLSEWVSELAPDISLGSHMCVCRGEPGVWDACFFPPLSWVPTLPHICTPDERNINLLYISINPWKNICFKLFFLCGFCRYQKYDFSKSFV